MKLLMLPTKNLSMTILVTLALGIIIGLVIDTSILAQYIIPVTILMIYPTMIGFNIKDVFNLQNKKLLYISLILNFLFIPFSAFIIGSILLNNYPQLFAGLAVLAILPTSNMTIVYTLLAGGDVPTAVRITVVSLILGALVAPWYLLFMVGNQVDINVLSILQTVGLVVFVPLFFGLVTYNLILRKYGEHHFKKRIKPIFPGISTWGMIYIVFTSVSVNSQTITSQPSILIVAFFTLIIFYSVNYLTTMIVSKYYFRREAAIAFVFSTAFRNLAIAMGLSVAAFGPNASLMASIAILVQSQFGAVFMKFLQIRDKNAYVMKLFKK